MNKKRNNLVGDFLSISKDRSLLIFTISGIGALGQAFLLRHELVDCYPYKIMSFPSASFYERVGAFGLFLARGLSCVAELFIGRMRNWFVGTIPVILCPIVFVGVFLVATLLRILIIGRGETGQNFDNYQASEVALGFITYSLELSGIGFLVGLLCTFLISFIYGKEKVI